MAVGAARLSAFRIVKDRYERTRSPARGFSVAKDPKRKNPGGAFWGHQPGFFDPREVPGIFQVASRICSGEVTSSRSCCCLFRGGDNLGLGTAQDLLSPSRANPSVQNYTRQRTPGGWRLRMS